MFADFNVWLTLIQQLNEYIFQFMAQTENFAVLKRIYEDDSDARKIAPSVHFDHKKAIDIPSNLE